ncbi:MAG: hypothetical protein CSA07_04395 [Bacteroidia bacterium]|nr:MAG: hypothetical protein CSA07_04395 [Bacteroidia bacterium]
MNEPGTPPLHVQQTEDGSSTLVQASQHAESYHSLHGALSEARYVFARQGLGRWLAEHGLAPHARVLEYGLGTGMNLLASLELVLARGLPLTYTGLELHPLGDELLSQLRLGDADEEAVRAWRRGMHAPWDAPLDLGCGIHLNKRALRFQDFRPQPASHDVVYFDAFSPSTCPELWSAEVFRGAHLALAPGGLLVTYSASGLAKRALRAAGFHLERLPGALGKRHMLLARKEG